jgi:hypothetical protein
VVGREHSADRQAVADVGIRHERARHRDRQSTRIAHLLHRLGFEPLVEGADEILARLSERFAGGAKMLQLAFSNRVVEGPRKEQSMFRMTHIVRCYNYPQPPQWHATLAITCESVSLASLPGFQAGAADSPFSLFPEAAN